VTAARAHWRAVQPELDPARLVFVDETGASTKRARLYGRALRGERCVAAVRHGHWKTTTFVVVELRITAPFQPTRWPHRDRRWQRARRDPT
jgi:hypothetical protein